MASLTDIYGAGGGSFLKAADIPQGTAPVVYIADAEISTKTFNQAEGPKSQLVLRLYGQDKKFGLNVTQARAIEGLYGGDYAQWVNRGIQIGRTMTTFQGQQKETIFVFPVAQAPLSPEQVAQGQQWLAAKKAEEARLAAKKAEEARASQAPAFSGPPAAPNAFSGPPPAPVEQTGSQFAPPTSGFGTNPFSS